MKLAYYGIDIPKYWEHDKLLTEKHGSTIAMCYALGGHNIPNKWKHDKLLKKTFMILNKVINGETQLLYF